MKLNLDGTETMVLYVYPTTRNIGHGGYWVWKKTLGRPIAVQTFEYTIGHPKAIVVYSKAGTLIKTAYSDILNHPAFASHKKTMHTDAVLDTVLLGALGGVSSGALQVLLS